MGVPGLPQLQVPTHAPDPVLPTLEDVAKRAKSLPTHVKTFPV